MPKKPYIMLYNSYLTLQMIILVMFLNIAAIVLCCCLFFIKPSSTHYAVIALIVGIMIIIDVSLVLNNAGTRFLIRCRIDQEGIHCSLFLKKWSINWSDIRVYGGTGYEICPLLFFSADASEQNDAKTMVSINKKRIVFEDREAFWTIAEEHMPKDIKVRLKEFGRTKQPCFYRR